MKKLLLIILVIGSFGCTKKSNPTPQQTSWLIGKWKSTVRYQFNQVTGKSDTVTDSHELTFAANGFCTDQNANAHSYKLGDDTHAATVNIYSGDCPIVKKTDIQFLLKSQLVSPDAQVIYNITDVYNKDQ